MPRMQRFAPAPASQKSHVSCAVWMSDWLLQTAWGATATMNVSMVSPVVFFVALCFCLVLNLLSAYVPAWRVAHTPIVDSLNQNL